MAATQQLLAAPAAAEKAVIKQASWLRFIDRVERGEVVDPSGQYVAKGTKVAVDAKGNRLVRPKTASAYHYRWNKAGEVVATPLAASAGTANKFAEPVCTDCSGGNPPVTTTFISSEGVAPYSGSDNPNGYVWDLKIGHGSAQGDHYGIPNSYTVLYSDLNKGAGGHFIYIGFTRVPANVSESPEVIYNNSYNTGPVTLLGLSKKYSYFDNYSYFASYSYPVWVDTGRRLGFEEYDLNQDVGGIYIHARLSKYPGWGVPLEIGVLSSNISSAKPPTGWTIVSTDLNEGAGGDYIYFCAKGR